MDILIYWTVNSITFALIAVGFTLGYGVSRLPNFAHVALYVLVGFPTWSFIHDFKLNYTLAIFLSILISSLLGGAIYRLVLIGFIVYKPQCLMNYVQREYHQFEHWEEV